VRLIVGLAYRAVDLSSWLCSKVFGIPTSHILMVMSDIESKKVMALQNVNVMTTHSGDALSLLRDHHKMLADTVTEKDAERLKLADAKPSKVEPDPAALDDLTQVLQAAAVHEIGERTLVVLDCAESAMDRPAFRQALSLIAQKTKAHMVVTGADIRAVQAMDVPTDGLVVVHTDKELENPRFARTLQEQLRKERGDKVRVSVMVARQPDKEAK
jgi:hypothetical protein